MFYNEKIKKIKDDGCDNCTAITSVSIFFLNSAQPFKSSCYITTAIKEYSLIANLKTYSTPLLQPLLDRYKIMFLTAIKDRLCSSDKAYNK
jgi:hypothetical protein